MSEAPEQTGTEGTAATTPESGTENAPKTIDAIASEFNVGGEGTGTTTEPAATPAKAEPAGGNDVESLVRDMRTELGALREERQISQRSREEADLNKLVSRVAKEANVKDEELVKLVIAAKYMKDASFKSILDARNDKPGAVDEMLKVFVPEVAERLGSAGDPQLVADQRAMQQSVTGGKPRSGQDEFAEKMAKATDADFNREWRKMVGR